MVHLLLKEFVEAIALGDFFNFCFDGGDPCGVARARISSARKARAGKITFRIRRLLVPEDLPLAEVLGERTQVPKDVDRRKLHILMPLLP